MGSGSQLLVINKPLEMMTNFKMFRIHSAAMRKLISDLATCCKDNKKSTPLVGVKFKLSLLQKAAEAVYKAPLRQWGPEGGALLKLEGLITSASVYYQKVLTPR